MSNIICSKERNFYVLQMLIEYEDKLLDMNTHVYRISVDLN